MQLHLRHSFQSLAFSFGIKPVEYAVSTWTLSRRTKYAAVEQKLHGRTHTTEAMGAASGAVATLGQKMRFPWSEKKCTGYTKFGGQGGSYLLRGRM